MLLPLLVHQAPRFAPTLARQRLVFNLLGIAGGDSPSETQDDSKWQLVESKVLTATSVRCAYYPTNVATSTYTCSYNTEVSRCSLSVTHEMNGC
jgi:hypothetical protein